MSLRTLWALFRRRGPAVPDPDARTIAGLAQLHWARVDGVSIDTRSPAIRSHPEGIEVRGWLLVRYADLPSPEDIEHAHQRLATLPPLTRRIFLMNRCDGRNLKQIARDQNVPVRQVRRHMVSAIAMLDGKRSSD